jgi:CheY-like chemotaxis protein
MLRTETPRVLVVDDDPAVIYAARALLARRGCRVEAAFKGLDAVARARAGGVDAVLLDLEMPEVDGLSVLSELCALKPAPLVVLMADVPTAGAREAVARGEALAVLRKPIEFSHAHVLITGKIPDQPIPVRLDSVPASYALAREALDGKTLVLADHAPLPNGTPVNVLMPNGHRKPILLTGAAQRPRGAKTLQVKLLPLTPTALAELDDLLRRTAGNARPISAKKQPAFRPNHDDRGSELYHRGMRRLEQGKYAQALQDLAGARELTGKVEYAAAEKRAEQLAGSNRARALIRRARTVAVSDPREALGNLEEAIRLEPDRASTHLEAAQLLLQLGEDLERAEERLGAAVHLAPSDPVPRLHLAGVLERAGRPQEALWAADAALALFPSHPELLHIAARLRRKVAAAPVSPRGRRAI